MRPGRFFLALAVGAIIGILFAPDKGINTRKKITKKRDEYLDDIGDKFDDLFDRFENVIENAETLTHKMRQKADKYLHHH